MHAKPPNRAVSKLRFSRRLGDHNRYPADANMKFRLKTLLIFVGLVAFCLAATLAFRDYRRDSQLNALRSLQSGGAMLLRSPQESATISSAEIWVNETSIGSFEINGIEYESSDARERLINFRLNLDRLGIPRMVYIDNEPGVKKARASTVALVYSAGFVNVGGQSANDSYAARRKLFASKNLLHEPSD